MLWVERIIMDKRVYVKRLAELSKLVGDDIVDNDTFSVEDLEAIRDRMGSLISQLEFWIEQDNEERFCYELKDYLNWVLKNYA